MKKQAISIFAFAFLASSVFFSCNDGKQKPYGNMQFDSIQINKTAYLLESDTASPSCNLTVNLVYPVESTNKVLVDSVNQALIDYCFGRAYQSMDITSAADSFKHAYISEYRTDLLPLYKEDLESKKIKDDVAPWYSYYQSAEACPMNENPDFLVYQINQSEFRGGAHGSYSVNYLNFNPGNGHVMHLKDIFKSGYKAELTKLLLEKLMKDTNTSSLEELQDKAYLQWAEMYPTENFYMGKNGVTFFYNIYEIAPYSSGTTAITLSYEELKNLMKENDKE